MNEYDELIDMILDFLKQAVESGDYEYEDSRERLEADVLELVKDGYVTYSQIIEMLDRQAAITERECRKPNWSYCETCEALEKLTAERERYREKFGKCIDYADAIHALMDDEGMA